MIAFGPVPSRRLGRSLGINNIPPKVCTYSCVYCQVGRTRTLQVKRCPFYEPDKIFKAVKKKVKDAQREGEAIDYLTFVSDGEPTLDADLGYEIDVFKSFGIKIGIITNVSEKSRCRLVRCPSIDRSKQVSRNRLRRAEVLSKKFLKNRNFAK